MKEIFITHKEEGQRIDTFLKKYLYGCSRTLIYKWLRKKKIKCNKKKIKPDYLLMDQDVIQMYIHDEHLPETRTVSKTINTNKTLQAKQIVFEDEDIIIVNKPTGITMTGTGDTLVNRLISYLGEDACTDTFRPAFVHRLDKGTSGLAVGVKHYQAARYYSEVFRERNVQKKYYTLVKGLMKNKKGMIIERLKKEVSNDFTVYQSEEGKETRTSYKVKKELKDASLIDIDLHTGMTHQIRVHFQGLKHPLAGDRKYGNRQWNDYLQHECGLNRLFLHAYFLNIPDFKTGEERIFKIDLPEKLQKTIQLIDS